MKKIRTVVWNEYRHERSAGDAAAVYPQGIHQVIADFLAADPHLEVGTAVLDEPEHGLSAQRLEQIDVLLWWGHLAHDEVDADVVDRVCRRVREGMGFIALHSAHFSAPFRALMGTSCDLKWRDEGEKERIWVVDPAHPIAAGLPSDCIELAAEEMYGERFDIPAPDELVFVSWFAGGEVFRSGCCFRRNLGKIFYFQPGHETHPTYYQPEIQMVIRSAVHWAAPGSHPPVSFGHYPAREPLR